jgi:hypothetical protein
MIIKWFKELDATVVGLGVIMLISVVGLGICAGLFIYYVSKLVT